MRKWKHWLSGFAGMLVTIIGMNLGLPVPVAVEIGNEAKQQIEYPDNSKEFKIEVESVAPKKAE